MSYNVCFEVSIVILNNHFNITVAKAQKKSIFHSAVPSNELCVFTLSSNEFDANKFDLQFNLYFVEDFNVFNWRHE